MTVKILSSGEVREVNDSFGLRLVEQGKAVAVAKKPGATARKKPAEKE